MISNDAQLQVSVEQMGRLIDALAHLKVATLPQNPQQFAIMCEADIEHLTRLHSEVTDYLARTHDQTVPEVEEATAGDAKGSR